MARIGDVWDSTTDVLAGRAGVIAPLALAAFVLPSAVQNAIRLYGAPGPGAAAIVALIGLAGLLANLWAQLAIIAVASHPATDRAEAGRLALRRLPANLLVLLVLFGLGVLLALPVVATLIATHYDFTAAAAYKGTGTMPPIAPGAFGFLALYSLVLIGLGLWISARLFLVNAVILNEHRALGALRRSFELTRGLTWKLIGVALLFFVVFSVSLLAAQSVVGIVFRLALGPENIATSQFMAAIAAALVTAAFTSVVQVFAARLYAAVTGGGSAPVLA